MKFVSYAQNFEDVMLWRALKHVENGFYVDVGAFSPTYDSVTKAFYDFGWSGINVEPNPELKQAYEEHRPRDIHICAAVSDSKGQQDIFFVSNGGLTSLDQKIAEGHEELGWTIQPEKTQVLTLADILGEHAASRDIHFLKIDAEGLEEKVIRGNDWHHYRPWVLVVEATLPMSQVENHDEWEPLLLSSDYQFVYADGLNRFYVAAEHSELIEAFKYPPNVFDDFVRQDLIQEQDKLSRTEQAVVILQDEAKTLRDQLHAVQQELHYAQEKLRSTEQYLTSSESEKAMLLEEINALAATQSAVLGSLSWRITKPLRIVKRSLSNVFRT